MKKAMIFIFCLCLSLILGVIDYGTGYEIAFSVFYLIPVVLCAWFADFFTSFIIAIICSTIWLAADLAAGQHYSHAWIPFWNTVMRFLTFTVTLILIWRLKKDIAIQKELTLIDDLTRIGNRRYFYDQATRELSRAVRYGRPFCMAFLDIDNFKMVNDTAGHKAADGLLRTIAQAMKTSLRTTDILARLGGDEFGIILIETGDNYATKVAERIKAAVLDIAMKTAHPVTVSIGIAIFQDNLYPSDIDEIIKLADQFMYRAKRKGKNEIVCGVFRKPRPASTQ